MGYDRNVFANCPFDDKYLPLLRPLLFTIIYLDFQPRIALERLDSGEARINKIISLLKSSRYAVHDLSRLKSEKVGEYYRLNMPFELGLDVGCRLFGKGRWARKRRLVLETKKFRYQAAISDLSNSDIAVHNDKPQELLAQVRNWLRSNGAKAKATDGPAAIWGAFLDFMTDNYDVLKAQGYSNRDIERLPVNELIQCMKSWIKKSGNSGSKKT